MKVWLFAVMLLVVLGFVSRPASADGDPEEMTVGAEFEITTPGLLETKGKKKEKFDGREEGLAARFAELVREKCARLGCTVRPWNGNKNTGHRVTFPDGFWINISWDSWCVEIQTKPATLAEWRRRQAVIEDIVFKTAADNGYLVGQPWYAGHFNIGVRSAFGDDGERFLRFFVDFTNFPELSLGVLGNDWSNAPALSMLRPEQRQALSRIIEYARAHRLTVKQVAKMIYDRVYTHTYREEWAGFYPGYFQSIGLKWLVWASFGADDVPMELRGIRAQRSTEDFILLGELFQLRMKYLDRVRGPIVNLELALGGGEASNERLVNRFYIYITEAGGDYERFRPLLEPALAATPVDAFLTGEMDWDDVAMIEQMRGHLSFLAASPFLREKMVAALNGWGARVHTEGMELLMALAVKAMAAPDAVQRGILEELLRRILATPNWQDLAKIPGLRSSIAAQRPIGQPLADILRQRLGHCSRSVAGSF